MKAAWLEHSALSAPAAFAVPTVRNRAAARPTLNANSKIPRPKETLRLFLRLSLELDSAKAPLPISLPCRLRRGSVCLRSIKAGSRGGPRREVPRLLHLFPCNHRSAASQGNERPTVSRQTRGSHSATVSNYEGSISYSDIQSHTICHHIIYRSDQAHMCRGSWCGFSSVAPRANPQRASL